MPTPAFQPKRLLAGSVVFFSCMLVLALGCGGPGEGAVSGQVLFDGKPLPGGRLTFRPGDPRQNAVSAEIDERGNFQAVLPAGEVSICIDNRELEPPPRLIAAVPPGLSPEFQKALASSKVSRIEPPTPAAAAQEQPAGRYVKIPERYYTIEDSQLKFTVAPGEQRQNIELKK